MWLKKTAGSLENVLSPVMIVTGRIGSIFIPVIMLITVIDVVGRRVFNKPLTSAYELTALLLTLAVFFTIAHCEFVKGHVTIEIVVEHLGKKTQQVLNSIMYLFFLGTFGLITRQFYVYAATTWSDHLTAGTLQIPVYPFTYLSAVGCTLLSLIVLAHFLFYLARAVGRQ